MRVVLQYRSGNVPEDQLEANVAALWSWVERLGNRPEHQATVVMDGGTTVQKDGSTEYDGEVFGVSIVEVAAFEDAERLTRDWPDLEFGGHIDVLRELTR